MWLYYARTGPLVPSRAPIMCLRPELPCLAPPVESPRHRARHGAAVCAQVTPGNHGRAIDAAPKRSTAAVHDALVGRIAAQQPRTRVFLTRAGRCPPGAELSAWC